MMNGIQFQSVQTPNALSSELRSVIRDNVLQFYVQGNGMDVQEEGITALYERLSQEDKLDGESNSIANQKKILERYCKDHGYTAIRHYDEDDGYSGTNFNRPGFQRMLADIKAGKIKRVIVKDMSTQVGCPVGCIFCESGRNGFVRNLTSSEIVQQIILLRRKVNRVGFMGMGEPLFNYDNLIKAIHILRDRYGLNVSNRRHYHINSWSGRSIKKIARATS